MTKLKYLNLKSIHELFGENSYPVEITRQAYYEMAGAQSYPLVSVPQGPFIKYYMIVPCPDSYDGMQDLFYEETYENYSKTRCRIPSEKTGRMILCKDKSCRNCPYASEKALHQTASIENFYEDGPLEIPDERKLYDPEDYYERTELTYRLFDFIETLDSKSKIIAFGVLDELPDKIIMQKLGFSGPQSTFSYWKMKIVKQLREVMAEYR